MRRLSRTTRRIALLYAPVIAFGIVSLYGLVCVRSTSELLIAQRDLILDQQGTIIAQQVKIDAQQMNIEAHQKVLDGRGAWMNDLVRAVLDAMSARWNCHSERAAWDQWITSNPDAVVPEEFLPFVYMPVEPDIPRPPR